MDGRVEVRGSPKISREFASALRSLDDRPTRIDALAEAEIVRSEQLGEQMVLLMQHLSTEPPKNRGCDPKRVGTTGIVYRHV